VPVVWKPGSLSLLEPSGPVQDCNGMALPVQVAKWDKVVLKQQMIIHFCTDMEMLNIY